MVNLDPNNVLRSTEMLAGQCKQIWNDAKELKIPSTYKNFRNIVLCGMGGSAYGGYVVSSLFKDELKIPLLSNNDYQLPFFADIATLVLLSSYSGTTEEVLSCGLKARERNLKIMGITSGRELGDFLKAEKVPALMFDPKFNPSDQPRLGTGYMVLGTIALLNKLDLITVSEKEALEAISELENDQENIKIKAKTLAEKIKGFIPLIISAEFLAGNAHIIRNQLNETAKSFSTFSFLPELNHHLMEGLKNPADKKLFALFISSELYSDKLKERVELTKDVIGKNKIIFDEYKPFASQNKPLSAFGDCFPSENKPTGSSKLSQMLNTLSFGGYLSLFLAFSYGQDPSLIPWVDYFKEQLAK